MHTVPVPRDYGRLAEQEIDASADLVAQARRAASAYRAPYEFYSALAYLDMAQQQQAERDRQGTWDYAALAARMAEAAIAHCGVKMSDDKGRPAPADPAATKAAFERVGARYAEIDRDQAIDVAPVLYAHMTVALSRAEHALNGGGRWRDAARDLVAVEDDLDVLWLQDSDDDGVVDMKDGAPTQAEDRDDFQDDDGVPDPDNDGDGVPDAVDLAPLEPETVNRWRDFDGAPDSYPTIPAIPFAQGQAVLSEYGQGYLECAVALMKSSPKLRLRVRGHSTDGKTAFENLGLSRRRVEAVQRFLLERGVPEKQIVATFHGDTEPILNAEGEVSAPESQRVDVLLN